MREGHFWLDRERPAYSEYAASGNITTNTDCGLKAVFTILWSSIFQASSRASSTCITLTAYAMPYALVWSPVSCNFATWQCMLDKKGSIMHMKRLQPRCCTGVASLPIGIGEFKE